MHVLKFYRGERVNGIGIKRLHFKIFLQKFQALEAEHLGQMRDFMNKYLECLTTERYLLDQVSCLLTFLYFHNLC